MDCSRLPCRRLLCVGLLALVVGATSRSGAEEVPAAPKPTSNAGKPSGRLDLSLGDLTRYMDAAELATPLPENVLEEIIVNGQRPEPLPERRVIPQGLGALIYAAKNPLDAWRILTPDLNVEIPDRTEDDVRESAGAFRARILEPGAIYD